MTSNAARSNAGEPRAVELDVPGMDCPSCAEKIVNSVSTLDGVASVDPQVMSGTVHVEYDPNAVGVEAIVQRVQAAGYDVESRSDVQTERFDVPAMDCASCAGKIENALDGLEGIQDRETLPATGTVIVTYDPDRVSRADLVGAIESAGYEVESAPTGSEPVDGRVDEDENRARDVWLSGRAQRTWLGGGLLVLGLVFEYLLTGADATVVTLLGRGFSTAEILYFVGAVISGDAILRDGYYSLRTRSLDIDLLMSLGILGAIAASLAFDEPLYLEAGMLAVLFSVAELMEEYAMDRARASLRELMDLTPTTATVRRDGEETTVPAADLRVGDRVVVRPGERVPADGTVVEGESAVDQAPITGESVPVDKAVGDEVFAGTINEEGYLEVDVESAAADSTLAHIIELVEDAQREKTDHERFVDRFSGYYTPVVVALALAATLVPPLAFGADWATWFRHGLALLVLACPCALVISTPVSVISGITSAARNGVLVKGGTHLEAMSGVGAVAFDKTGTLTRGELAVTDVVPAGGESRDSVLATAASLEARSEHPIATAIREAADEAGGEVSSISGFESLTGKGVRAELDGETYYAGKPGLFEEAGLLPRSTEATPDGGLAHEGTNGGRQEDVDHWREEIDRVQEAGETAVLVGTAERITGLVAVADELRADATRTVERLHDLGVEHVVMLTGDNETTARAIGDAAGVDDVRAGLLPAEKADAVAALDEEWDGVAMVGDGVNDAPALATATVGIAMGAAGTDAAVESADVALMADDLTKLPYLYALSRKANGVIRENIWVSIAAKALLAVGVPFGLVNVAVAIVVGDMGMSLGVTTNALRLARIAPDQSD